LPPFGTPDASQRLKPDRRNKPVFTFLDAFQEDGLSIKLTLPSASVIGMVFIYTFAMSWLGYKLIDSLIPMRVSPYSEKVGLDFSQHDEHYGLAHIGERELAEYEEHIKEKESK
jgi:hypothetical protein